MESPQKIGGYIELVFLQNLPQLCAFRAEKIEYKRLNKISH
jgi:hypothetical protein